METLSKTATLPTKDALAVQLPVRVCMHVLGPARSDVRVMREATALIEAGFAVSIVDVEGKNNQPVEEEIQRVHVKHIIMSNSFVTTRFTRWVIFRIVHILIRSTFRLMRTPADIYHAHDITGLPACYIVALLRRKPLIFDAHELPFSELSNKLFSRMRTALMYILSVLVSHCAGVITVSPPIAREICDRYHASVISLVRNIPMYQVVPKSERLRQHLGLGSEMRIALYQGVLQSNRGLERLIHSAKYLEREIVIVLMGRGEMQAQLEALIVKEGVASHVKIIPPVPYAELLDWTASADIGLIIYAPDYSQNVQMCLPNKLFEYLMAGLPVLVSQLDAVAEIISGYGVGRVVSSLAPEDVGESINAILANSGALAQMRCNALDVAQREFCWERESHQLISFYKNILRIQK